MALMRTGLVLRGVLVLGGDLVLGRVVRWRRGVVGKVVLGSHIVRARRDGVVAVSLPHLPLC